MTTRTLNPPVADEFRRQLMEARARLLRTVATTDDELATLEAHQPGAPIEDCAREAVLAILGRMGVHERRELEDVHAAYARLEAGTFGVCEACGAAVPLDRLRAVPTARHCVDCQVEQEAEGS